MMEWILSACVLTAAVIGLRYALGGRIDPRLQYALWALVLVRLLIPVNFGWAPFSVGNAVPALAATTSVSVDSAAEGITVPSIQTADPAPATSPEAADPAPATTVPVSPGEEGQGLPTLSLDQGLTLLWLVGMAAVALFGRVQPPLCPAAPAVPPAGRGGGDPPPRLRHPGRGVPLSLRPGPSGHLPAPKDFGGPGGPALRRGP